MYVCICNAIRESDFRRVGRHTTGDATAVYKCLGKTPQCGQCLEDAECALADERSKVATLTLVAA